MRTAGILLDVAGIAICILLGNYYPLTAYLLLVAFTIDLFIWITTETET